MAEDKATKKDETKAPAKKAPIKKDAETVTPAAKKIAPAAKIAPVDKEDNKAPAPKAKPEVKETPVQKTKAPVPKAEKSEEKKAPVKKDIPKPKAEPEVKEIHTPKKVPAHKEEKSEEKKAPVKKDVPKPKAGSVNVYSLDGKIEKSISLPDVFNTQFRPDMIRRAVKSSRANRRQPYGPAPRAGMRHAVSWPGKGKGMARTPRLLHGGGKGAEVPNTPGGRRAHPPRPEKDWSEKINKKEKAMALKSAIAAVGKLEMVQARGHRISDDITMPMVVTDDFEELFDHITKDYQKDNKRPAYTKETAKVLEALGLSNEMDRAKDGIHQRAGRGKTRGRRFKKPSSILFVVNDTVKARKCLGNLPGVDIIGPTKLNVELLAPGGDPGRLTVFTEKALLILGGE
jgi:large subunit ribosomal protein L4e